MATSSVSYTAWTALTSTNLETLLADNWWCSPIIDNTTTLYMDIMVGGKFAGGGNIADGDIVNCYVVGQYDSAVASAMGGGIAALLDPQGTEENALVVEATDFYLEQLTFLGSVTFGAASKIAHFGPWSIGQAFGGYPPERAAILVHNAQTTASDDLTTGNLIGYMGVKYTSA